MTAPKQVYGVLVFSGLWGTGKTTLALTADAPEATVLMDFDQKSQQRAAGLGVAYYSPSEIMDDPLAFDHKQVLAWFRRTLLGLPGGRRTLIIDNASPVETAFGELVAQNPRQYGVKAGNVASGSYGGVNPGIGSLWESSVAYLRKKGYERIIIVMHMSQLWVNGVPVPNRYKVKGNKTLTQLSNLSLLLLKPARPDGVPDALVLKEALGIMRWDAAAQEYLVMPALPPRIPGCNWQRIAAYLSREGPRTGYDPAEFPTDQELACYGMFMSDEQVAMVKAIAANPKLTVSEEDVGERDPARTPEKPPTGRAATVQRSSGVPPSKAGRPLAELTLQEAMMTPIAMPSAKLGVRAGDPLSRLLSLPPATALPAMEHLSKPSSYPTGSGDSQACQRAAAYLLEHWAEAVARVGGNGYTAEG